MSLKKGVNASPPFRVINASEAPSTGDAYNRIPEVLFRADVATDNLLVLSENTAFPDGCGAGRVLPLSLLVRDGVTTKLDSVVRADENSFAIFCPTEGGTAAGGGSVRVPNCNFSASSSVRYEGNVRAPTVF